MCVYVCVGGGDLKTMCRYMMELMGDSHNSLHRANRASTHTHLCADRWFVACDNGGLGVF